MSTIPYTWRLRIWSLLLIFIGMPAAAFAQNGSALEGQLLLQDWPSEDDRDQLRQSVLPFIDSLRVDYEFSDENGDPSLAMWMEWIPDGELIYEGRRRSLASMDEDIRMVAVELRAGAYVRDVRAASIAVVVDSMVVGAKPDFVEIHLPGLSWSDLFVDVGAEEARSLYAEGFELRDLEIVSAAFAAFEGDGRRVEDGERVADGGERLTDDGERVADGGERVGQDGKSVAGGDERLSDEDESAKPKVVRRRPPPRHVSVYRGHTAVDIVFDLFWLMRRDVDIDRGGEKKARGTSGRGGLVDEPRSRVARAGEDRSARDAGRSSDRGQNDGDSASGVDGRGSDGRSASGVDGRGSDGRSASGVNGRGSDRRSLSGVNGRGNDGDSTSRTDGRESDGRADVTGADGGRDDSSGRSGTRRDRGDASSDSKDDDSKKGRSGLIDKIKGGDSDDDDDDDDNELVPYAIAAAAGVGLVAVAGGTIGYFANMQHARYGITSGLTRDNGGLLLQVGVNEALLHNYDRPKHLLAKLLAFGNLLNSSLQPALGFGVLATSDGGSVTTEPSISLGAVARPGPMLFYGGYDFYQEGVEFGIALNIRDLGLW